MLIRTKLPDGARDLPPEDWAVRVIGEHGGAWAAEVLAAARDSIREERRRMDQTTSRASSGPAEYGVPLTAEELGEANAALGRAEEIAAALEEKLTEWRGLVDEFGAHFEHEAMLTAFEELSGSSLKVDREEARYEHPTYGSEELALLSEDAGELSALHQEVVRARRAHWDATVTAGLLMDQVRRLTPGHAARVAGLEAAVQKAELSFNLARAEAESDHPILAAYTSASGLDQLAALASEGPEEVKARLRGTIAEKREAIAEVQAELERDPSLVWELEVVLEETAELLGYADASVEAQLLKDHLADRARNATTREVALGMTILGLGAASLFTMGTSGVAASGLGGKLLLGTSVAVNGAIAVRDLEAYRRTNAARRTDFDTARVLTREVPSLFWLGLSVAALGLEIGAAAGVFARLERPALAAMRAEGQDAIVARSALAKELEAARVASEPVLETLEAARTAAKAGHGARGTQKTELARRWVTEAFGSDAAPLLKKLKPQQLRELERDGVMRRLAAAERAPVLAVLGRGADPRDLDAVLAIGERLQPGTGAKVLRYLAGQHVDEVSAARTMLMLDLEDAGHTVLRHGPHLDMKALEMRVTEGLAPDGVASPASASTRFRSFRMMKRAYEDARGIAARVHRLDLSAAPGVGGKCNIRECVVVFDYGKPVSRGFLKAGASSWKEVQGSTGRRWGNVWSRALSVDELVTRTRATFEWDGARWRLVQLFPDATGLNAKTGLYSTKADKYLRY